MPCVQGIWLQNARKSPNDVITSLGSGLAGKRLTHSNKQLQLDTQITQF
jgi:hypothetical protein